MIVYVCKQRNQHHRDHIISLTSTFKSMTDK